MGIAAAVSACRPAPSEIPRAPAASAVAASDVASAPSRQSPEEWLRANAAPVRLPPFDADDSFSDLEPLKGIVGSARIVGLGEESHGDGTAFRMKARLIRYLHERLDFDVLAFESPLVDCETTVPLLAAGAGDGIATIRRCISSEWSRTQQLRPFVKYLAEQARAPQPLTTTGFDILPRKMTVNSLRAWFRDAGFPEAGSAEPWDTIRDAFFAARDGKLSELPARRESARAAVSRLRAALKVRGSFATADLLERALQWVTALTWWIDDLLAKPEDISDGGVAHASTTNGRDEAMAANVAWLIEKRYPGKKIHPMGCELSSSQVARRDPDSVQARLPRHAYDGGGARRPSRFSGIHR